uniref:CUB domain-containing protein n=1 Tax=Macrostomum lignano TaxID=282301 RepID=A0A1I8F4F3_9PLAT
MTALGLLVVALLSVAMTTVQEAAISGVLPQQPQVCTEFIGSQGWRDDSFCFTSPFYPAQYPNNTDCIKAGWGQRIELDFKLSSFLIERSSECLNDYLEIRDGPFGYSPPLRGLPDGNDGRLCGEWPPTRHGRASPDRLLRSSGRFLWLRFRSDEVIRHRGLRLVYRFVSAAQLRAPTAAAADKCLLRYRIHSGRQQLLTSKQFGSILAPSAQKDAAVECTADFSALREDTKLLVSIATAQFLREGQCHANSISVYDGFTAADRQRKDFQPVCDNLAGWTLMAATRRLVVRLTAKNLEHLPLLQLAVTAVRIGPCQSDTEFDCGAGRCIDSRLRVCNGYANCPDVEDEGSDCPGRGAAGDAQGSTNDPHTSHFTLSSNPVTADLRLNSLPRLRLNAASASTERDSTEKPTGKGDEGHHASAIFVGFAVTEGVRSRDSATTPPAGTPTSEPANGSVRLLSETKLWRQSPSSMPLTATQSLRRLQQTTAVPLLQLEATGPLFPVPPPPPPPPGLLFQPEPGSLAYLDPGSLTNNLTARQQHQILAAGISEKEFFKA